jgi:hypothetical protein
MSASIPALSGVVKLIGTVILVLVIGYFLLALFGALPVEKMPRLLKGLFIR